VLPKPIDEITSAHAARGEAQHELLLFIHCSGDIGAVEEEERRHRSVGDPLVAVRERMPLRKGEAQRTGLLNQSGMKVASAERCPGLRDRRFERAQIPNARSTTAGLKHEAVQFNHLAQGQISHQARRRYSSWFFRITRAAATWKSSAGVANTSATTALARSSGESPRRSASRRSCSAWAADSSILSFMRTLYRGGTRSSKPLEQAGTNTSRLDDRPSAGRSAPGRWADEDWAAREAE